MATNLLFISFILTLLPLVTSLKVKGNCQEIHVIGLEGVGHHGFGPVLNQLAFQTPEIVILRRTSGPGGINIAKGIKEANYSQVAEGFRFRAEACLRQTKTCVSFGGCSYPCSRSPFTSKLKSVKRWEPKHLSYLLRVGHPIHISKWFAAASKHCDIRFVLLHRNFVETVFTHRTWDTGVRGHSEVLLLFAEYIDVMLKHIPQSSWVRFDYEDFWSFRREEALKALVHFLGWEANVQKAFESSNFRLQIMRKVLLNCPLIRRLEDLQSSKFNELPHFSNHTKHVLAQKLSTFSRDSPRARFVPCRGYDFDSVGKKP